GSFGFRVIRRSPFPRPPMFKSAHSRASGNPGAACTVSLRPLGPRLRGDERLMGTIPTYPYSPARSDLLRLAGILHVVYLSEHVLVELAVGALHHLDQVFVHDDIARVGIDHDLPARAVELPALERCHRLVAVDLALERLRGMHDRRHAVEAADREEVGRRIGTVGFLPFRDE